MAILKSASEIQIMRQGGKIGREILEELVKAAKAGKTTLEIDQLAEKLAQEKGVKPAFKNYEGYQFSTCLSVNEVILHGLPSSYALKRGDVLTIDWGVLYQGFNTDLAISIEIGSDQEEKFLKAGQKALENAIVQASPGHRIGDISFAMQSIIEQSGYNVIRAYAGHGVGKGLHELPQIPCFGYPQTGEVLRAGMTLAIEVMYSKGSPEVKILEDGWTTTMKDKSRSAMFEETVVVTQEGPLVLTKL